MIGIQSLSPPTFIPPSPPFSPSLISLMVSVDVKHHVHLVTYYYYCYCCCYCILFLLCQSRKGRLQMSDVTHLCRSQAVVSFPFPVSYFVFVPRLLPFLFCTSSLALSILYLVSCPFYFVPRLLPFLFCTSSLALSILYLVSCPFYFVPRLLPFLFCTSSLALSILYLVSCPFYFAAMLLIVHSPHVFTENYPVFCVRT